WNTCSLFFPHQRQFSSGGPLLSFLVLLSFFNLPTPLGIGPHERDAFGWTSQLRCGGGKRQRPARRVIPAQHVIAIVNRHGLVQMLADQHAASRQAETKGLLRN